MANNFFTNEGRSVIELAKVLHFDEYLNPMMGNIIIPINNVTKEVMNNIEKWLIIKPTYCLMMIKMDTDGCQVEMTSHIFDNNWSDTTYYAYCVTDVYDELVNNDWQYILRYPIEY